MRTADATNGPAPEERQQPLPAHASDCPSGVFPRQANPAGDAASEEDERVAPRRDVKVQDLPEDDRVVAGEVLGELSSHTRA